MSCVHDDGTHVSAVQSLVVFAMARRQVHLAKSQGTCSCFRAGSGNFVGSKFFPKKVGGGWFRKSHPHTSVTPVFSKALPMPLHRAKPTHVFWNTCWFCFSRYTDRFI